MGVFMTWQTCVTLRNNNIKITSLPEVKLIMRNYD